MDSVREGPLCRWHEGWCLKDDKEPTMWQMKGRALKHKIGLGQTPKADKNWMVYKHREKTSMMGAEKERKRVARLERPEIQAFLVIGKSVEFVLRAIANPQLNAYYQI